MPKELPSVLRPRMDAGEVLRALLPTRARVCVEVYDHREGQKSYRTLPGFALLPAVYTAGEVRKLWAAIEATIEGDAWKDHDARQRIDPGGAGAADRVG